MWARVYACMYCCKTIIYWEQRYLCHFFIPRCPLTLQHSCNPYQNIGGLGTESRHVKGTLKSWDSSKDEYTVVWSNDDNNNAEEILTPDQVGWHKHLAQTIGTRIAKWFDDPDSSSGTSLFEGTVVGLRIDEGEELYYILYDDGDEEELEVSSYKQAQRLYEAERKKASVKKEKSSNKTNCDTNERGRQKRDRGKVRYAESDDDDDDDASPVTKGKTKKNPPKKKRKTAVEDDDFSMADAEEDDVLEADSSEEEELMAVSSDEEVEVKPKRGKQKATTTAKAKPAPVKSKASTGDAKTDEFHKKLEKDRKAYKPNNNPQKWPADGDFVDPVGVDPTHGIVEGIIATQVRKVGGLLQLAMADEKNGNGSQLLGELGFPIRLQTACSGTDAPSIGLGLIKENMDILCPGHSFDYSHEMSCEIEPFKQAYIARNFPGVPLFPDITKLTASEKVLDVYGRPQTIPDGNLFVAGTSCKDFSMLKTTYRLDIEDKGTSGETFLAAVEFLEQKQPRVAIFENVDGAPWSKMQEYITGRVYLPDRNETKAIKDASKKAGE